MKIHYTYQLYPETKSIEFEIEFEGVLKQEDLYKKICEQSDEVVKPENENGFMCFDKDANLLIEEIEKHDKIWIVLCNASKVKPIIPIRENMRTERIGDTMYEIYDIRLNLADLTPPINTGETTYSQILEMLSTMVTDSITQITDAPPAPLTHSLETPIVNPGGDVEDETEIESRGTSGSTESTETNDETGLVIPTTSPSPPAIPIEDPVTPPLPESSTITSDVSNGYTDATVLYDRILDALTGIVTSTISTERNRYRTQLTEMEVMGFTDREQNLEALMLSNGNVEMAINYLLSI